MTVEVCKLLQKLRSVKAHWTCNRMYQNLYSRAKKIVKKDACIKFHDMAGLLY